MTRRILMNREPKLLGYYNYTVYLTYIGMIVGFIGIVYAFEANPFGAVICLLIAGFCDMFDGAVASTRKRTRQERCFGIQIDSLSDLICFGVLPASIAYNMNRRNSIVLAVSAMYVLCALIRLAYFNVDEQSRQEKTSSAREVYYGMPVTLSAIFVPLVYGFLRLASPKSNIAIAVTVFIMSMLFLLPFPLRKPKLIGKICVLVCGIVEVLFVLFAGVDV